MKGSKETDKEIPSIPTSYRILIKGASSSTDSKQLKVNVDDKRHIWRLCSFKNPARSDGLVLRHWRHFEKGADHLSFIKSKRKFVRNKILKNIDDDSTCTLAKVEEEESILDSYSFARDLDPTWTKDETDLLFDLCEMFELRFIAIHDCFKWRKDIPLEKMKQRYYTVTKRIVEFLFEEKIKNEIMKHGNPNHPVVLSLKDESARHPLVKFTYNSEHDRERRQMLERSYRITPEQREAETELLNEIKNAEALLKTEERKRNDMKKLRRKFNMNEGDVIPVPKMDQFQTKPVWLASSCLNFYKSQLTQHHNDSVDEMLSELNISPPTVSSQASNELYCIVRGDAAIMINVVNKVESLRSELEHWQQLVNPGEKPIASYSQTKLKEETFSEGSDHPVYPITHTLMSKSFPKPKQPIPQIQPIPQAQPVGVVPNLPNMQNVQSIHDDNGKEAMMQTAARQRMMIQSLAQKGQQMKQMYPMKPPNSGGASPHSFHHHMYPQFPQQMYQPQLNPRMIQQHMAHRMIQQQQFQQQFQHHQQKQHFQHMMPMHPDGPFSPTQRYSQPAPFPPVVHPSQLQKHQPPSNNNQKQ